MRDLIKGIFSDHKGNVDEQVLWTLLGLISLWVLTALAMFYTKDFHFDPQGFGFAHGAIAAAGGAGKLMTAKGDRDIGNV